MLFLIISMTPPQSLIAHGGSTMTIQASLVRTSSAAVIFLSRILYAGTPLSRRNVATFWSGLHTALRPSTGHVSGFEFIKFAQEPNTDLGMIRL